MHLRRSSHHHHCCCHWYSVMSFPLILILRTFTLRQVTSYMSLFLAVNQQEALLVHTEQSIRHGHSVYLIKFFRYLPKCKLKWVCSQPCNSNTAAPSVESRENENVLYMWSQWIAKWIFVAQVPVYNALFSVTSANITINDISLKTRFFGLFFHCRHYGSIFNHFYVMGPECYWIRWNNAK